MAVVNPMNPAIMNPNVKDSRWLTLEVCREFQRSKCTRTENECKFAHPPAHVEVQNGRVIACFDSIKGKCQRKEPPCKYLHPPQHLREQLLQNGRNNLILKSLQMHAYHPQVLPANIIPMGGDKPVAYSTAMLPAQIPYLTPHYLSAVPSTAVAQFNPYGMPTMAMASGAAEGTMVTPQMTGVISTPVSAKPHPRPDRLEPQVIEVVTQTKKRLRQPAAEEIVMPPYVVPPFKRMAVESGGLSKGGIPMYQPSLPAAAYQQASLLHLHHHPSYPVTYNGEVMSAAYTNYLPQVAGHPHTVPRY